MKWNYLIFILSGVVIMLQLCNCLPALPSEPEQHPFSISLKNSKSNDDDELNNNLNSKFSLQDSVARILRALAEYQFKDQIVGSSSTTSLIKRNDKIIQEQPKWLNRQSRFENNIPMVARNTRNTPAGHGIGIGEIQSESDRTGRSRSKIIISQPLRITEGGTGSRGTGRSLKNIDVQGVRVIVGQRVPDDPQDKYFTWRNARVIKGVLVPSEEDMKNVLKNLST